MDRRTATELFTVARLCSNLTPSRSCFFPLLRRKETTVKTNVLWVAMLSLGMVLIGSVSLAEDKKENPPDEKALMEAMMKAATPGEQHKKLAELAGSWEFTMKMWFDPSKSATESKGTSESKAIMGGRYLEEKIT